MGPRQDDAGETLVESVISLLILSIAVVAIVTCAEVGATVTLSHRNVTIADTAAKTAAEAIKAAPYVVNATSYSAGVPTGFTASTSVACLPLSTSSVAVSGAPSCAAGDTGVQAVTVTVASTSGREAESVTVVKRR